MLDNGGGMAEEQLTIDCESENPASRCLAFGDKEGEIFLTKSIFRHYDDTITLVNLIFTSLQICVKL